MIIEIKNIRKNYNLGETVVKALDDVSFSIEEGELVSITGTSGSGKSTLMHILGCLDTPNGGKYILDGKDVSNMKDDQLAKVRNTKIGFVFQSFNLLSRASALENVELPLLYGMGKNTHLKAREALEIVGLKTRMKHEPNQLSGGQRQRVAIARAIVSNPSIILADEPTGNLDSKSGKEILDLFSKLNSQGKTVIIVTHDKSVANFCNREITLRDGKII